MGVTEKYTGQPLHSGAITTLGEFAGQVVEVAYDQIRPREESS